MKTILRKHSLLLIILPIFPLLLLCSYMGLSIEKAFSYTTTPPQETSGETPATEGLTYEDVSFLSSASDHLALSGWWVPQPASRRVVILVHGRYENRTSHLALVRPLWERGFNVLLFDLRGHGYSPHAPCTYGLREQGDVIAAVDFAREKGFDDHAIAVIGWSLGAASALMAMSQTQDIAAVVSDSAYANEDPLLAHNLLRPGLTLALRFVLHVDLRHVSPETAITHIGTRHVFLIHGEADQAVPVSQAYRLQRAGGPNVADMWVVPNVGHIQAYASNPSGYIARIVAFLDKELH